MKTRELVKVKIQKSVLQEFETRDLAATVAVSTGSMLVEIMGHTFTLYKKRVTAIVPRKTKSSANEARV